MKDKIFNKDWAYAALIRAIRTFAQVAIATIGTSAIMSEVNWPIVLSTSGLSAIISVLMSLTGLPEVEQKEGE